MHNEFEATPWITAPLLKVAKFKDCGEHICRFISTCNVLIARRFYDSEQLALRFDNSYALTGGSDKELFNRAIELHQISTAFETNAIVYEFIPEERTTVRWFFNRYARIEFNTQMRKITNHGAFMARVRQIPSIIGLFLRTLLSILNLPFSLYPALRRRRRFISFIKKSARLWGLTSSFLGLKMHVYRKTTGW